MAFADLLVHRANIYDFNTSVRDDYNVPVLSVTTPASTSGILCRFEYFIPKMSGIPQQEVELIEEKPARLFIPGSADLTNSNYAFHISADTDNLYIIQELKVIHASTSAVHHYELMVVPLEDEVSNMSALPTPS